MPAKPLEQEVQTIGPGTYVELVPQLKIWHTISQIQAARKKKSGEGLRNIGFYGGDGFVCGLKGGDVWLYLTDANNNPGFENPEQFAHELISNNNFFLDPEKSSSLEAKANDPNDNSVIAFNLSELKRKGVLQKYKHSDEFFYVEVSKKILVQGKRAFRKKYGQIVADLFDRVHGDAIYGKRGVGALLSQKNEKTIEIYVPNPNYVKKVLKGKEEGTMIARASYVYGCDRNSYVLPKGRNLDGNLGYLRGVLKKSAEGGDAQKIMTYKAALNEANRIAPKGTPFNLIIVDLVNKIYGR